MMIEIIWWYLWLGVYVGTTMQQQKFAIEPQDQTAIIGTTVTLPCRVINKSGTLQWTRDDFALGIYRNLSDYPGYSMIGTDEEGDFSLSIDRISMEDNAKFQCQVGSGSHGEPAIRSKYAALTVLVPPERPIIEQGSVLTTTEDREIELECVSKNGKPAAEITWIDGLGNVATDKAEYRTEVSQHRKLTNARSILKITPKKEHHNTTYVCHAHNTAERTSQSAKLLLLVKYAPKVTIKINGSPSIRGAWSNQIVEGTDVRISCSAEANPPVFKYSWYLNDSLIKPDTPTEWILKNVSRFQNEAIVKCEAENGVGKSEDSETLHIFYGPRFVRTPQSVQAEIHTPVSLICEVDGNPIPEISWIHEKYDKKVISRSSNLTIRVGEETSGRYICKAFTKDFAEIAADARIYIKGKPVIRRQPIRFGTLGDNIRLDCVVYSIPKPDKITWSFNGRVLGFESVKEYSIREENMVDGVKSVLVVRDARSDQFGTYNCTVSNDYGTDAIEISLRPQRNLPIMLVSVGIMGGVVVVVTVILITILCQRKPTKLPLTPPAIVIDSEKQCKDSDRSSNISDIKLEIRTGSSASNQEDCNGGHDTDSIITRVGPLPNSLTLDSRYSINRFSSSDYPESVLAPKLDGQSNNGYVPYVDYTKNYNSPPSSIHSSHAFVNPYLRTNNSPTPSLSNGQPPPPPYCTLRNGNIAQLSRFNHTPKSQYYIVANNSQQGINKNGSLATHV